mgnify:CR=1 FL=1
MYQTQSTRYMGIETIVFIAELLSFFGHNLLAIWVLKHSICCCMSTKTWDTIYSLYGYWNVYISSPTSKNRGHNLLAIWVLKHMMLCLFAFLIWTQSTRYMGIETSLIQFVIHSTSDTIYSLYGYWNTSICAKWRTQKMTQSTRYMGIETWVVIAKN